jgi:hypothetical protein
LIEFVIYCPDPGPLLAEHPICVRSNSATALSGYQRLPKLYHEPVYGVA